MRASEGSASEHPRPVAEMQWVIVPERSVVAFSVRHGLWRLKGTVPVMSGTMRVDPQWRCRIDAVAELRGMRHYVDLIATPSAVTSGGPDAPPELSVDVTGRVHFGAWNLPLARWWTAGGLLLGQWAELTMTLRAVAASTPRVAD